MTADRLVYLKAMRVEGYERVQLTKDDFEWLITELERMRKRVERLEGYIKFTLEKYREAGLRQHAQGDPLALYMSESLISQAQGALKEGA